MTERTQDPMHATDATLTKPEFAQWQRVLIWMALALSCVVFIEPAPYDYLVMLLIAVLFSLNLKVPDEASVAILLLALFAAGSLVGALLSGDPDTTIRPLITRIYMTLSWLLFTAVIAANADVIMRVIWSGYTFAALFASLWGILEYYNLMPSLIAGDAFGRAKGPFKDPNVFGPFLVPIALHTASLLLRSKGLPLAREIVKFLIIAIALLLSFSRGAWGNVILSSGIFMVFSIAAAPTIREKMRLVVVVMLLAVSAGLAVSWAVNSTVAGQRFVDRAKLFKAYDIETGGRFDTQGRALQEIGTNPLGIGPGMSTPEFGMEPHNLYLHAAIEGGWVAGIGFCLFLVLTLARGMAAARYRSEFQSDLHVVVAVILGTLAQSLFIDSTHWRHMWLLFAMCWGLSIAVERERLREYYRVMSNTPATQN